MRGREVRLAFSTEKSRQVYERTLGVLVEASSSSSRGPANFGKYPIFMERGRGSRIYDVDGNEYIDWMMAFGALPLGHAHPEIVEAIVEAAATGAHFATATPVELAWSGTPSACALRTPARKP
jgi:glutamate-1-semialdehyde 2,1-aminomutase